MSSTGLAPTASDETVRLICTSSDDLCTVTVMAKHRKHHSGAKPRAQGSVVMGRNCLREILQHDPERIQEVYVAEGAGRHGDRRDDIGCECERLGISVIYLPRTELEVLAGSDSHQGIAARVYPRPPVELDDLLASLQEEPYGRLLALDSVLDPHNLGAILRAAECFGVHGVLWPRNRSAPIGPVVSKVSVGASELVTLVPVPNLHRALEALKKAGWWLVGAAISEDAVALDSFTFPERSVIVLGSEGEGMHDLTERTLDFKVFVPMEGQISSLNVSQASAVFLSELAKQHRAAHAMSGGAKALSSGR